MVAPKRLLLLSVSAGSGQLRAAEALRVQAGLEEVPVSARHLDAMQFVLI